MKQKTIIIILAGGTSSRFISSTSHTSKAQKDKVFESKILTPLLNKPAICHLLNTVCQSIKRGFISKEIVVVATNEVQEYLTNQYPNDDGLKFIFSDPGYDRQESALKGLEKLAQKNHPTKVLIHDGARALLQPLMIEELLKAFDNISSDNSHLHALVPAIPVTDTLRQYIPIDKTANGTITPSKTLFQCTNTIERKAVMQIQTPQLFNFKTVLFLHQKHANLKKRFTDDAALYEHEGNPIYMIEGDFHNIKLTYQSDITYATRLMQNSADITKTLPENNFRVGNGYDIHPIQSGEGIKLCGIYVKCGFALKGHSDADVALHALCDAILGAIAQGDIGDHFPPNQSKWQNTDSSYFLHYAKNLSMQSGYTIANCDITIIAEKPKIQPLRMQMRKNIADIIQVELEQVSVKATTNEGLDSIGQGKAIAVHTVVLLQKVNGTK